jgi:hypothetical protein
MPESRSGRWAEEKNLLPLLESSSTTSIPTEPSRFLQPTAEIGTQWCDQDGEKECAKDCIRWDSNLLGPQAPRQHVTR